MEKREFKVGDKVKIPKTKSKGCSYRSSHVIYKAKRENQDYLFIIRIDECSELKGSTYVLDRRYDGIMDIGGEHFTKSDLEHYEEEFVLPKCWFVLYTTKEEFHIINSFYNKGWSYCGYENQCGYHNNGDNQVHTNNWIANSPAKEKLLKNGYIQITFEQFQKYVLKEETMEKEIIGYKLIKPKYRQAAEAVVSQYDPYYDFKNWDLNLEKDGDMFTKDSNQSKWLKEAGVLDLWFEPVYAQEKQIIQMHSSNKGMFEIEVVDGKAYYRPENKYLPEEWIRDIINSYDEILIQQRNGVNPYSVQIAGLHVGCYQNCRKEDWEKVYKLLK